MGLLDNLERGLERAVRSAFSAGGARAVQPVEIASALRQEMDDESFALSEGHTVAPNDFTVHFAPADFERARTWGSTLASELCDEVIRHAQAQGYSLPGSVRVAFHSDDAVRPGRIDVVSRLDDGSQASAAAPAPQVRQPARTDAHEDAPHRSASAPRRASSAAAPAVPAARPTRRPPSPAPAPAPARPAAPVDDATLVMPRGGARPRPAVPALAFDGRVHPVALEDMVVGRSAEQADIVVPDSSVSRRHLRLVRVGAVVTLIDLGSRNGVEVNGRRVDGSTVLRQGDRITVGRTEMVFHADAPDGRTPL